MSPRAVEVRMSAIHAVLKKPRTIDDIVVRWQESTVWTSYATACNLDAFEEEDKLIAELERLWISMNKEGQHVKKVTANIEASQDVAKKEGRPQRGEKLKVCRECLRQAIYCGLSGEATQKPTHKCNLPALSPGFVKAVAAEAAAGMADK